MRRAGNGHVSDRGRYFKTDEATRQAYRDRGMGPFAPGGNQVLKSYYEVPGEIVEDDEQLAEGAREAAARGRKRTGRAPAGKKRYRWRRQRKRRQAGWAASDIDEISPM